MYKMAADTWNRKKCLKLFWATLSILLSLVLTGSAQRTYMRTCDCEYVVDGKCAYTLLLPLDKNALPPDGDSCPSNSGFPSSSPSSEEFKNLVQNVSQLQRYSLEQAQLLSSLQASMIAVQQTVTTVLVQNSNTSSSPPTTGSADVLALKNKIDNFQARLDSMRTVTDSTTMVLISIKNDTDTLAKQVQQLYNDKIPVLENKITSLQKTLVTVTQGSERCLQKGLMASYKNGTFKTDVGVQLSSQYNDQHGIDKVSVHATGIPGAWCPKEPNGDEWIQFDLGSPRVIYGMVTRGRADYTQWVTSYQLQYGDATASGEEVQWTTYADILGQDQVFPGNSDQNSLQTNMLWQPITAQMIRLIPLSAFKDSNKCMRADLIGCVDIS